MFKRLLILLFIYLGLFSFIKDSQAAVCQAEVNLVVKSFDGSLIPQAKFSIYEQTYDANNLPVPGKQLASGTTDKYTGLATVKVNVTSSSALYAVRVTNPSLKQADFWYFNELLLNCNKKVSGTVVLSGFRVRVSEASTLLAQKDVKFIVYSQARDAYGAPLKGVNQGSFSTGSGAETLIYAPAGNRSLSGAYGTYLIEFRNSKGLVYTADNLNPLDKQEVRVDYRFSELLVTIRDSATGNPLPNIKLSLMEKLINRIGDSAVGRNLLAITTDNNGQVWLQYPPNDYVIQLRYPDGRITNYPIVIKKNEQNIINLMAENYSQAKCKSKTEFKPAFRDTDGQILNSLSFALYEQVLNINGNPKPGIKVLSGSVDSYGYAVSSLVANPAKHYSLEVCDKGVKLACFWFFDLSFDCNTGSVSLIKQLPATNIVVRTLDKKLAVGQKLNLYLESFNVDGQPIIDNTKQVGNFNLPANGQLVLHLAANDWQGNALKYVLIAPQKGNVNSRAVFNLTADQKTDLDYVLKNDKLELYSNLPANFKSITGRIVLITDNKNEAWYINSKDNKRYLLGGQALQKIRKLASGISNKNLARIPLGIAGLNGSDTDSDGLPDNLEIALGTNPNLADTDFDGFSDYQEVIDGFNPVVSGGKLAIDNKFAKSIAGRFFIQVEGKGQLWYVFPVNNKRYYLGLVSDINNVMKELGLGISGKELKKIPLGQ